MKAIVKIDLQTKKHLFIQGEEDLAAVALSLVLPLGSCIYYGQPQKGMVELVVTEKIKQSFFDLLKDAE
jgi:uncharacterized protein (UPF0218 family)